MPTIVSSLLVIFVTFSALQTIRPTGLPSAWILPMPRGQLFYFIKGSIRPERIKVRTSPPCNIVSIVQQAVGSQLAYMPLLLAGIDLCFSCKDRMVTVREDRSANSWTWEALRIHETNYYQTKEEWEA